jgi:hypothetical protein
LSNLINLSNQSTIKSTELVELINEFRKAEGNETELQHKTFMEKIRKESETLKNLNLDGEQNFLLGEYLDKNKQSRPCFELNRDGMLQMLNSESAYVRYKTINYINTLEDKLKEQSKPTCIEDVLIQSLQQMKDVKKQLGEVQQATTENRQEIQNMRDVMILSPNAWRKETSEIINKIAQKLGGFDHIRPIREESYKLLDEKLGVSLSARLLNKKKKMALEGVPKSKMDKANKLDVIEDDKKLINGYVNIIKEMAIKYKVA